MKSFWVSMLSPAPLVALLRVQRRLQAPEQSTPVRDIAEIGNVLGAVGIVEVKHEA